MGPVTAPPTNQSTPSRGRGKAPLVLAMLVVGLVIGAMIKSGGNASLVSLSSKIEIIGTLWINAIRMTVIPLVAALTIASVATSGDAASLGRTGGYAVLTFA